MKVRLVTESELWTLLVKAGFTPKYAKLQCRLAYIYHSEVVVDGETVRLLRDEETPSDTTYADQLAKILESGDTSIRLAAHALHWPVQRVYATAKNAPETFSVIGIVGSMQTWNVSLAGDRPIHLVQKMEGR